MGRTSPRLAPPVPATSMVDDYEAAALDLGITLLPWQLLVGRYLYARRIVGDETFWRWLHVAVVAARQNGKTELLLPFIWQRIKEGRKVLHTAQNRLLPKETFDAMDDLVGDRDEVRVVRRANGQEAITLHNGGRYQIVAPNRGTRGRSADDIIIDEVREQRDMRLQAQLGPTITARHDPQVLYLSNAGSEDSVLLNDLRHRRDTDPALCYLEWSAGPERALDDREGWAEANPALGHLIQLWLLEQFRQSETAETFETERLCRWVLSMQPRLVSQADWLGAHLEDDSVEAPRRPVLGLSMAGTGRRVCAVLGWQQADGRVVLRLEADVTGDPINTERLGRDLGQRALRLGVSQVTYDDATDRDLARYFTKQRAKPMIGKEFANASEYFPRALETGRLGWVGDMDAVAQDLAWAVRQQTGDDTFVVGKATDERPIPGALAAVRAAWLASAPRPHAPRVL